MHTTKVTNLITGEQRIYVNNLGLKENIISAIIEIRNETCNLLNKTTRQKYGEEVKESTSTITGRDFAFAENYDLHASLVIDKPIKCKL